MCSSDLGLPRAAFGMALGHAGFGIVILGIAVSQGWKEEKILLMAPGEETTISGRTIAFIGEEAAQGPNWRADRAQFEARSGDRVIADLTPERRWYPVERQVTTNAAIRTNGFGDIYAVIGEPEGQANHEPGTADRKSTRLNSSH